MGSDSFQNIKKWKNYEPLLRENPLFIYKRPGFEIENKLNANITVLDAPLLEISSTDIRKMIKNGKSIRFLVPDIVKEEIDRNHYYNSNCSKYPA